MIKTIFVNQPNEQTIIIANCIGTFPDGKNFMIDLKSPSPLLHISCQHNINSVVVSVVLLENSEFNFYVLETANLIPYYNISKNDCEYKCECKCEFTYNKNDQPHILNLIEETLSTHYPQQFTFFRQPIFK
jgi:hypothetical protein